MMQWSSEGKWIIGGFALIMTLLGIVSTSSYQNSQKLVESANQVQQANDNLDNLTDISAMLAEAESRLWGYILFDQSEDLQRHTLAIQKLSPILAELNQFLSNTPIQKQRFIQLEKLIYTQINLFQQSIDLYQNQKLEEISANPLVTQAQDNLNIIRQLISELEAEEEELLEIYVTQAESNLRFRLFIEPVSTFLTFAILAGVFVILYRQMLKRQQAEAIQRKLAQSKELSELKVQLFSMVSHEFRTPLSLILGSAQLLGNSLKSPIEPGQIKNLHRIQASAKTMTQLLSDILTLARADAGKLEFNPEWVEMQTFCLNLVEDFRVFSESQHTLQFSQEGDRTHAYIDEKLVYSILSNLLSNAIKYSPPQSAVYLSLTNQPNSITFKVQDQGIGIPPEDQHELYEPFRRGTNTKEIGGTGLGLAVVKKCLELHGGEIWMESEVGAGTTFYVKIPQ
jgi:signal transduction histidine kinase